LKKKTKKNFFFLSYSVINHFGSVVRVWTLQLRHAGLRLFKGDVTHLVVHAKVGDLGIGELCHSLEVVEGASGDSAEKDLLRGAPGQGHLHSVMQLVLGVDVLVLGKVLCVAESSCPTRND